MLPPRQTRGFILVRKPEKLVAAYEKELIRKGGQKNLQNLRKALNFIDPNNYRGIDRYPLEPWSKTDEDLFKHEAKTLIDLRINQKARRRFLEINGEDREEWDSYVNGCDYNQDLIQNLSIAQELQKVVDTPEDFEITEVARSNFGTSYDFLGFDIGYWDGDHFSIICDSSIMPRWHGPAPESLVELGKQLRCLNKHLLFSTPKDAENFRKYYKTQPWAELESSVGEFCVIQVAAASTTS